MKRKTNSGKVVFKEYNMGQQFLLPPSLEEMVPERHLVRVVNQTVERMDLKPLIDQYKGGGTSSYHPKMLLKVLIYAYTQQVYSSRQITKRLRENIHFMWLSGQNQPDFRTINRFRSSRMKPVIEHVFQSVVQMLIEEGFIELKNYFLDGTIIEANANRYSYIWKKSNDRHKQRVQKNIKVLWDHIERVNDSENEQYGDRDLEEVEGSDISSERMDKLVNELNEKLRGKTENKEIKKAVRKLEKEYLPKLKKYERQEEALAGKNSYSKTDTDATFMRTKDDHLGTGQLKAAYNVQTGTENQFIVGYSVHQKSGDTSHLIPHLEKLEQELPKLPENLVTDSGYGSEENYRFIAKKALGNFVKYPFFHREQQSLKKDQFRIERFRYEPETDRYLCPENQYLTYQHSESVKSEFTSPSTRRIYQCQNCTDCAFRADCLGSDSNRTIKVNLDLNYLKETAKKNLLTPLGKKLRTLRSIEVESVFGQIKHNMGFRRFNLRGIQNVSLEWGLISISHNLKKIPL